MFTNVVFVENLAQCCTQLWVLIAAHNSERRLPHLILYKHGHYWKCSPILPAYLPNLPTCLWLVSQQIYFEKIFKDAHSSHTGVGHKKLFFFYSCCKKFTLDRFLKILSSHTGVRRQFFVTLWHTWLIYLTSLPTWPTFLTKQTFS